MSITTITPPNNASDTFTVTARVIDERGASNIATTDVVVVNAPPEMGPLTLNGIAAIPPLNGTTFAPSTVTIDEDGVLHVAGIFTDPGIADTHVVTIQWGDGTSSTATVSVDPTDPTLRRYAASHRYLDDDPTATHQDEYEIVITARDDAGAQSSTRATLTVENVAPVLVHVDIDDVAIDENDVVTITGTVGAVTDVGTLDTHVVEINWGDGTSSIAVVDKATGKYVAQHRYLDDNPTATPKDRYTITVVAQDDDGDLSNTHTAEIEVSNVAPANLVVAVQQSVIELSQPCIVTGSFGDIGSMDTHIVQIDWGDGTRSTVVADARTRTFSAQHFYQLEPDRVVQFQIRITVVDDDGATVDARTSVTVYRVADIELPRNAPAFSPSPIIAPDPFALSDSSLPEGNGPFSGLMLSGGGVRNGLVTGSINRNGEGNRLSVGEGGELRLPESFTDKFGDFAELVIDWGDGSTDTVKGGSKDAALRGHVYKNDSGKGVYRLSITVTDAEGKSQRTAFDVTVHNMAPTLEGLSWRVESGPGGDEIVVTGQVVDPGANDEHIVSITWSDGSVTQAVMGDERRFTGMCPRDGAGTLIPVKITVTDTKDPASSATIELNGSHSVDRPQNGTGPQRKSGLPQPDARFATAASPANVLSLDAMALAFGTGIAGLAVRTGGKQRPARPAAFGAVVLPDLTMQEASSALGDRTGLWIDTLLAERFARVCGRSLDAGLAGKSDIVPDGWHVVGHTRARSPIAEAPEDWVVVDDDSRDWPAVAAE